MFRNLGPNLSSDLIVTALVSTYVRWVDRYGHLPTERLRTEVEVKKIKSSNPGYCYKMAGWTVDRLVRGKLYLLAPETRYAELLSDMM